MPNASADTLARRLRDAGRRFAVTDGSAALVATLGLGLGVLALAAAMEAWLWLPPPSRSVLTVLVAAAFAAPVVRALRRPASLTAVARRVANALAPTDGDRLLTALDLATAPTVAPSPLMERATSQLVTSLDAVPLERAATFAETRRVARVAWVGPVLLAAAFLAAPGPMASATARLFAPLTAFSRPAPFALTVHPGDATLAAGDSLRIVVTSEGRLRPATVEAELIYGDGTAETVRLAPNALGAFVHTVRDVRRPLRYRIAADPVETETYRVNVRRRPAVETLRLTVAPPSYTGEAATALAPGVGDVTGLRGTRVSVSVDVQGDDLEAAYLDFGNGKVPLNLSNGRATGGFTVAREGSYRVVVVSKDALENEAPVAYRVALLPDHPPDVFVASPSGDAVYPSDGRLDLDVRATDDYGVAAASLVYRIERDSSRGGPWQRRALPRPASRLDGAIRAPWLPPRPPTGATVAFYVEARDAIGQTGRSAVQRLRTGSAAPPPPDPAEAVEARQDSAASSVQTLQAEAQRARDAVREVREALRGGRAPRDGLMQQMRERQAAMQRQADEARRQAQELRQELARQDASPEIREQYRQLQQTLEELLDPEMQEALRQLEEAMREERVDEADAAAERYAEQEEALRERLEQAQRLMERLRTQQQLDQTAQQAEDLAQRERDAAEEAREIAEQQQPKPGESDTERQQREAEAERRADALEQQQRDNAEAAEALEQQMRDLEQRMQQTPGAPRQQMRDAREQMEAQNVPEQIEQSADDLAQDRPDDAAENAEQAAQAAQRAQQQMRQMQQQMQQRQQQMDAAAMRRALDDVLRLSQQQEALRQRTERTSPDSPGLADAARQQQALERSLDAIADTLGRIAERSPVVSRALQQQTGAAKRQMRDAAAQLAGRQPQAAVGAQRSAMEGLNELALRLTQMMQSGQGGQSGSSQSLQQMLQQMQQMAGNQQQMNAQTQRMIDSQQGERLNPDGQSQARQMAERQQQLQREMRNLARNPESRGRMMDDLQTMARQMDAVAQELRRGRVTRELQEQQRQILSRMLEAQRSLQQRGEEQRREASPPGSVTGQPPGGTPPPVNANEQRRRDLLRALDAPYSPDVEALIRRYFQRLGGQN